MYVASLRRHYYHRNESIKINLNHKSKTKAVGVVVGGAKQAFGEVLSHPTGVQTGTKLEEKTLRRSGSWGCYCAPRAHMKIPGGRHKNQYAIICFGVHVRSLHFSIQ